MTVLLGVVFAGYVVVVLGLAVILYRGRPPVALEDADLPTVAITVAARNEEAALPRSLEALRAQDYPADRITIVIADDHSTDRTAEIVLEAAAWQTDGEPQIRYVRVSDPIGALRGKAQAIHQAIESVDADLILITDADCAPVETWARGMAAAFADPTVGVSCGLARVVTRPGRFFDRVQSLDWSLLLGAVAAAAEVGAPATGMGNNMGLRKSVYDDLGGYPALPFSVTEDFALVQAVAQRTASSVRFPLDPQTTVWTFPVDTVLEGYQQRKRWAKGGLSGGTLVLLTYTLLFGTHALLVAGLILSPLAGLAAFAGKMGADAVLLSVVARRTGAARRMTALPVAECFMAAYLVTLPAVLLLRPSIGWKGRTH